MGQRIGPVHGHPLQAVRRCRIAVIEVIEVGHINADLTPPVQLYRDPARPGPGHRRKARPRNPQSAVRFGEDHPIPRCQQHRGRVAPWHQAPAIQTHDGAVINLGILIDMAQPDRLRPQRRIQRIHILPRISDRHPALRGPHRRRARRRAHLHRTRRCNGRAHRARSRPHQRVIEIGL